MRALASALFAVLLVAGAAACAAAVLPGLVVGAAYAQVQDPLDATDPLSRVAAIQALVRVGGPGVRLLLERALHDPDARVRSEAIRGFDGLPGSLPAPALIARLDDEAPSVRRAA